MSQLLHIELCCTANISRSPTLEVVLRHHHPKISFHSSSLYPWTGVHHPTLVKALAARGYKPVTGRPSVQLTQDQLNRSSLVLVAEEEHYTRLCSKSHLDVKSPCYLMMNVLGEQADMLDPHFAEITPQSYVVLCEQMAQELPAFLRRIGLVVP